MKKFYCLLLFVPLLISNCNNKDNFDDKIDIKVTFTSIINQNQTGIHEIATSWNPNDQIGMFVEGYSKYNNVPYTNTGAGFFSSFTPIYYPKASTSYNITAYYPYKATLQNNNIQIDLIKDQRNIRFSNNLKGLNRNNRAGLNRLEFNSVLPKIYLIVNPSSEADKSLNIEASITHLTKGEFSVKDGSLKIDENSTGTNPLKVIDKGEYKIIKGVTMPSNPNKAEVTIKVNGNSYKWEIPNTLKGGYIYPYTVEPSDNSISISYLHSPNIRGETYILRPIEIITPPDLPDNPETPGTPAIKTYMETPVRTSESTSPNGYQVTHMITNLSWLNNSNANNEDRNYTIHFDTKEKYPVWIAYPLHISHMTSGNRTDDWQYDPLIPTWFQPDLSSGWQSRNLSRGHMLPSASRSATRNLNRTTFYYTNMVAQNSEFNSSTWNSLEEKVRYWSKQTSQYDTLYVVTGSILPTPPESVSYTYDVSGQKAAIPKYLYKALCRKNNKTGKYYTIGFKMENSSTGVDYIRSVVPVEKLEEETGFKFFPQLPDSDAGNIKKQTNLGDWS